MKCVKPIIETYLAHNISTSYTYLSYSIFDSKDNYYETYEELWEQRKQQSKIRISERTINKILICICPQMSNLQRYYIYIKYSVT